MLMRGFDSNFVVTFGTSKFECVKSQSVNITMEEIEFNGGNIDVSRIL